MTGEPTLALLIPAFNAAKFLPRLLESANRQTEPFDEIWVYDDCSTDCTVSVAEQLGARVVRATVNGGCSHARNALAATTSADWLHFHDADDELLPNFVALARSWMENGRVDIVLFPYEERDDATDEHIAFRYFDSISVERDARSYTIREQVNPFCGLYRREAFLRAGGYDEDPEVLYNEDVAAHIRFAFADLTFAAEKEVSIINHRRRDSMSAANRLRCLQAHYHVMRSVASRPDSSPYADEIARRLWYAVAGLASELDWRTADEAATLAMRLANPSEASSGLFFKGLCRLSPRAAIRLREGLIRALKPRYREGYPGWRAPVSVF